MRLNSYYLAWTLPLSVASISIAYAVETATFVSQTVPTRVEIGKSYDVIIVYKNTGTHAWDAKFPVALHATTASNTIDWGVASVPIDGTESIPPGESKAFSFRMTAPQKPGAYPFEWALKQQNNMIGNATPKLHIQVDDINRQAEFVSQLLPDNMAAGGSYRATVQFRNTGKTPWDNNAKLSLTAIGATKDVWGINDVAGPTESTAPGDTITFGFNVMAPIKPGSYSFQWQLRQNGGDTFGEPTPTNTIIVGSPGDVRPAEFVYQKVPTQMKAGSTHTVTLVMKNTGGHAWRHGDVYLMPQNPPNNLNWATDRVDLDVNETIKPGDMKTFTFAIRAPTSQAIYPFTWQLYHEGKGWFGDQTEQADIQVYR